MLLKLLLQEIDQVLIAPFIPLWHGKLPCSCLPTSVERSVIRLDPGLGVLEVTLQTLDYFLTEVGSFGQFLLNFLMDLDFPLVRFNLLLHFIVFNNQ